MFDYSSITEDCVKCGKCIPVCTIHQVNPDETTSPRGFIELLGSYHSGELELDRNAKSIFESCFLCTNCVDVCPNKLPTDFVIENVRYDIAQKYGIAWYKKAFFRLLKYRTIMDIGAKMGYIFKSCAFEPKKDFSMRAKFDLPIMKTDRILPSVAKKSFMNKYPEELIVSGKRKVAIFIGCMANYVYTEVGDSLINILSKLEIDVLIPKKQLCCAAPPYFTGDFETTRYLIQKNIEYFETFIDDVEAILIPEATCSSMIKHDWVRVLDNEDYKNRAKKIIKKCYISTEWLSKYTDLEQILSIKEPINESITYHDPCHSRKTQGVWKEPRGLLKQNYNLVEMSDPNKCCGFGGVTIQSEKHHLAIKAGEPKREMIEETNAKYVVAECSACRMQLNNSLGTSQAEFRSPLELISKALNDRDS